MKILNSIDSIKTYIEKNKFAFVYFSSAACGVCGVVEPKFEELLKKYSKLSSCHVDVDNLPAVTSTFGVYAMPTIIIYLENKEVFRQATYINFLELNEMINRYLEFV